MAELQEVEVRILPDGHVQLSVKGVKGSRCRDLTAGLEWLLGGAVVAREHTPEFDAAVQDLDEQDRLRLRDRI